MEQAWELLGYSDAMEALVAAYKPGRTFAQAFAEFYAQGLCGAGIADSGCRVASECIGMGAPVLRAGIERADELHAALAGAEQRADRGCGISCAGGGGGAVEPAVSDRRERRGAAGTEAARRRARRSRRACGRRAARDLRRQICWAFWMRRRSGFRLLRCCGRCSRIFCWGHR